MKNVTVSLDDDTYRLARVRDYLRGLGSGESEFERLHAEELELRKKLTDFRAGDRLNRDEAHERRY